MKELTQKEEEILFDYERKFGKEKADEWRQKLLDATETEVEESAKTPNVFETQGEIWFKVPEGVKPRTFIRFFNKIISMMNEVRELKVWHGFTYIMVATEKGVVFIKQEEVVVNPESEDTVLKSIDEMPEDRIFIEDTEEDEKE